MKGKAQGLRWDEDLEDEVNKAAEVDGRSFANMVEYLVRAGLEVWKREYEARKAVRRGMIEPTGRRSRVAG